MEGWIRYLPYLVWFVTWISLWGIGGWLLARHAFRLRPNEEALTGLALGTVLDVTLVNLLAQAIPFIPALWLSAGIVLAAGVAALFINRRQGLLPARPRLLQMALFLGLLFVFVSIQRGLAMFDDYAFLPTTSIIATGDIPPHFALADGVIFYYHYLMMLFAGQLMQILPLDAWVALDISRGLSAALAVMLSGIWAHRLTRSRLAGFVGGLMAAFGSGTRWLLLLLPDGLLARAGETIELLGSGAGSGPELASALSSSWAVEGAGPIPFPFAFANGIYAPGVIGMNGPNGLTWLLIMVLLLLTFNRWRNGLAGAATVLLIAATGLVEEVGVGLIGLSWVIVTVAYFWRNKTWRLPASLRAWWIVVILGNLIGVFQGGAWTEVILNLVARFQGKEAVTSYQTMGLELVPVPSIVSSHLGILWLNRPFHLLAALAELGPVLLVFPLLIAWGLKAFRRQRWYEVVLVVMAILSLGMLFVHFSGSPGVRNTSRMYVFIDTLALFAVPLVWMWAAHRPDWVRGVAAGLLAVSMFGGLGMFAVELPAVQKPVYSYFITALDARMARAYWNQLEPGTMVFDADPYRAPTLFGRPNDSSTTWFASKPEWQTLRESPDPLRLRQAGYAYFYLDNHYWQALSPQLQQVFNDPCVQLVDEYDDQQGNFRRLYDIRLCR